ncbi:hypothetical protein, partial [Saccharopolyspora sp. NPDC002686]|uniref:hypothetical protein n=1 Tax=Saccharopolyspora sp. NPDC002686 TaxID=3154541 RepID=UPI0033271843
TTVVRAACFSGLSSAVVCWWVWPVRDVRMGNLLEHVGSVRRAAGPAGGVGAWSPGPASSVGLFPDRCWAVRAAVRVGPGARSSIEL